MKFRIASSFVSPHIHISGLNPLQTLGLSGFPKSSHARSLVKWGQRIIAGLPCGIAGNGELIDGNMQQAAHPLRHSIDTF